MSGFFRSMAFKKCMLILIWGVTLFAVGFGISFYRGVGKKYDLVQEVPIKEISVEGLADGTYTGEYTYETLYAKVSVIVKGEEIKKITLDQFETERARTPLILSTASRRARALWLTIFPERRIPAVS